MHEPVDQPAAKSTGAEFESDDATVVRAGHAAVAAGDFPQGLTTRELAHALRGEMLDHFHLQQFVGGGGMGVVFRALDTTLDRVVAVKVVASHQLSGEDLQRRFLVEAQSTARLDHPNIARVHYIGRDLGLPYIVFEFIDGVNVRDLVSRRGPLPLKDALSYTFQIAQALAHAWQRDVVHRDIKPSNILVTAEGQAKLVDMGLARLTQVDAPEEDLTATGVTLGTFDYISPEQARDARDADTRSDIYSLGCSLYFMLTGEAPFSSERSIQKLLAHQSEPPPDVRRLRPDVPEAVENLIARMLAKSPEDRPSDPIALVNLIWNAAEQSNIALPGAATPLPEAPSRPAAPWKRRLTWVVPVGLALAAAPVVDHWLAGDAQNPRFPELQKPPRTPPAASSANGAAKKSAAEAEAGAESNPPALSRQPTSPLPQTSGRDGAALPSDESDVGGDLGAELDPGRSIAADDPPLNEGRPAAEPPSEAPAAESRSAPSAQMPDDADLRPRSPLPPTPLSE